MKPQQRRRKKKVSRPGKPVGCEQAEDERRNMGALMEAFSSVSVDQAASAYREVEGEGDLNRAAEILGRLELESSEYRTRSPACSSEGFVEMNCGEDVNEKRFKGGNKKKRAVAATGTVSTVLGKDYVVSMTPRRDSTKEKPVNREKVEQFLCSMLEDSELGMAVVRDVLCQCGYNFDKALDALLDLSASSNEQSRNGRAQGNKDTGFLCSGNGNVQSLYHNCRNYAKVLASTEACCPPSPRFSPLDPAQKVLESLFNSPKSSEQEPSTMNWKDVKKKMESLGQGFDFYHSGVVESQQNTCAKEDEYQVFRQDANQQWDSVRSYYQKAAMAHSNGDMTYAAYLADQGKQQTKMALQADEKASRSIFEARNKAITNVITIDLHGQHVKEAMRLLKIHLVSGAYLPSVRSLRVITGCGSHGMGKSKLKQSVINLLDREGIEWSEENQGTVVMNFDGHREFSFSDSDNDIE